MTDSTGAMPVQEETVKIPKSKNMLPKKSPVITVILKPHTSSFQTRTLELKDKQKVRIGRQTSSKTIPTAFNGFFDSKVLSRQHAEIWCEKSIVYIKDVKSSNGTFINGERLSNEGEESEPRDLNSKDEIEFGIDIVNDNGSIMYHKVSCTVYIFPVPLSQIDDSILKELSNTSSVQVYPDPHSLSRKSSASSLNTISSMHSETTNGSTSTSNKVDGIGSSMNGGKKSKKLESILIKLQSEIEKSKQVENELKTIKETVVDLEKLLNEEKMKKSNDLQIKLKQAENTIEAYESKWRYQNQAINTAKCELQRLEKELSRHNSNKSEKEQLAKELLQEKQKTKELEEQIQKLSNYKSKSTQSGRFLDAFQIRSVQFLFAVLIGIISTLIYVLYN